MQIIKIPNIKLLFLTLFFFNFGCSFFKSEINADLNNITYQSLLENHSQWENKIKSLKGYLKITLDTPQYSGNFDATILVDEPDSMLLEVAGPFGMRLGKVFVSKNRFIFYNQVMNQFYKGSKEDFSGRNFLQFPVEIGQLKDIFIARDTFKVLEKEKLEIRDNKYYLEAKNGHFNYHIWFDPKHKLISRIEYLENGNIFYFKEYQNFKEVNGIYFPHHVNFVRPETKQGLSIFFTELQLNISNDPVQYRIKVADTATQIDLTL